jgi:hypothetical protein
MRPSEVKQAIVDCASIGKPLMIWGPAGVGKSDTVRQAALVLGQSSTAFQVWDFRAALRDAVDLMGLPGAVDGQTFYNLPAGLPRAGSVGLLFLDEINSARPDTQGALYQLMLDRRVGDYELPSGVQIVAAGNRANDRGIVHRMPDPLVNRLIHVEFEADLTDWCQWAMGANVRPEVIAFLRTRSELLNDHDPARKSIAFATPRAWASVSLILDRASPIEAGLIKGTVGDGAAGEFLEFLSLYRQMVSPDQILLNPGSADVPVNSSILYALAMALARRADLRNFDRVMTYAARMPQEYESALVAEAARLKPELTSTHDYIAYQVKRDVAAV